MEWYTGEVVDAVKTVKQQSLILLVFIKGDDELSQNVNELFEHSEVATVCKDLLCLKLDASSQASHQFRAIYPVLSVPCIYLVAPSGKPIDSKMGSLEQQPLIDWIVAKVKTVQTSTIDNPSPSPAFNSIAGPSLNTCSNATSPALVSTAPTPPPVAEPVEVPAIHKESPVVPIVAEPASSDNQGPEPANTSTPIIDEAATPISLETKLQRAQQLIAIKQQEREEETKQKELTTELSRRSTGKALQQFKEQQQQREIEERLLERKREEAENRRHLAALRHQIEEDRKVTQERWSSRQLVTPSNDQPEVASSEVQRPDDVSPDYFTRLQLRLLTGGHVVGRFAPDDTLRDGVRVWLTSVVNEGRPWLVESIRSRLATLMEQEYQFRQLRSSKLFTTEEEGQPLEALGLCPSAVLVLVNKSGGKLLPSSSNKSSLFSQVFGTVTNVFSYASQYVYNLVASAARYGRSWLQPNAPIEGSASSANLAFTSRTTASSSQLNNNQDVDGTTTNRAIRRQGNMARLSHLPDSPDDEQARWNGNSTEQL